MPVIKPIRHQKGVLLLETIIVVIIVGILAAIAVPALSELLLRKDIQNARDNIMQSLKMARQIAQSENTIVDVTIGNGKVRITPRNSGQLRETSLPERVKITGTEQSNVVGLIFRPSGTAAAFTDGQVIDSDSGLQLSLSPANEHPGISTETIFIGSYGNIAEL